MLVKLKELLTIKNGRDRKHLDKGNIPVIGTGGVMTYVDEFLYDKEAILLPRKGSLNNVMYINKPFRTVDTMFYAIPNVEKVNGKFLYYYLSLMNFERYDLGSTIPSMTAGLYYTFAVNIPERKIQDKIAGLLTKIDNQIERNNRMVQSLQVLGKSIFSYALQYNEKSVVKLGAIANMYQPQTITANEFIEDGKYYVYGSGGIIGKYDKYNHENSELMVSCRGLCGNISLSIPKSRIIGNQMVIQFKNNDYKYFIYNYLQSIDLHKIETGSVQKQITRTNLEKIEINIINEQKLKELNIKLEPIYKQVIDIIINTDELTRLKNNLLPLLMNGQLK